MDLPMGRPWPGLFSGFFTRSLFDLLTGMDHLMDQMYTSHFNPVKWEDQGNELVLRMHLPNMDRDRLEVRLGESSVSVRAEAREELRRESQDGIRTAAQWGVFRTTLPLPVLVDSARGQATYRDGVLELRMPKRATLPIQ